MNGINKHYLIELILEKIYCMRSILLFVLLIDDFRGFGINISLLIDDDEEDF